MRGAGARSASDVRAWSVHGLCTVRVRTDDGAAGVWAPMSRMPTALTWLEAWRRGAGAWCVGHARGGDRAHVVIVCVQGGGQLSRGRTPKTLC